MIREKQRDRSSDLLSSCSALEGDRYRLQGQGQMVRARLQGSRYPRDRAQLPDARIVVHQKDPGVDHFRGCLGRRRGRKHLLQGDPSVQEEPLYVTPLSEGRPGVPEGALIRLEREVYGLVSGMSGWRSRIVSQLKGKSYEMNVYVFCPRGANDRTWGVCWLCVARGGRSLDGWPRKGAP